MGKNFLFQTSLKSFQTVSCQYLLLHLFGGQQNLL